MTTYNHYTEYGTGTRTRYLVNSVYDTPEEREKASKLAYNSSHCQIQNCIEYNNGCNRKHKKGIKKMKCKDYKSRFENIS